MSTTTRTRLRRGHATAAKPRQDAIPKVAGEFAYSSDLHAADMLWGHTVRSPHAHARIVEIDVSEAVGMAGVHAVLTHEDVPGKKLYGLELPDQPVLAIDRVRYFGEAVAVVAAEEPEQARRAGAAVRVEYEPLEPIVDPERATEMEPLHVDWPIERHGDSEHPKPNVVRALTIARGDPDAAGDVTVSGYYEVGQQDQAFLGPESGIAIPDGEGGVDIHVATQWLHVDRDQIAPCLGLQPEQVRIHLAGVGGAFGGREDLSIQLHAALLALRTARPVKMVYSREESFVGHIHRHPARIWAEHRATSAGRLVLVTMRILLDGGAYASSSTAVISNACSFAVGPYAVDNVLIDGLCVYTNNPPCGAMRGFGAVQSCFAAEAQMDKLAAELEIDPVELRLLNALEPDGVLPTGQVLTGSLPTKDVIRRAAALPVPEPEELPRDAIRLPGGAGNTTRGEGVQRGVGFAVGFKNVCYSEGFDDYCTARVVLRRRRPRDRPLRVGRSGPGRLGGDPSGREARARHGRRNPGDGLHGGRRLGGLLLRVPDDVDGGRSGAARVPGSGRGARARRRRRGGRRARVSPSADVPARLGDGPGARRALPRRLRRRGDAGRRRGGRRSRSHARRLDRDRAGRGSRAERTGGRGPDRRRHRAGARAGADGGDPDQGRRDPNPNFTDYLIPTFLDMPPVVSELVEVPEPSAPYGVKGVGEPPTVVSTAAIVAALRNATGRDLTRVPVRPDDIVGL